VYDIADDSTAGQREIQINLKPGAAALGFTTSDVANQMRGALFGLDAHVYAAAQEDIDVRVRLDEATRRDLYAVENLWIISPAGRPVPLGRDRRSRRRHRLCHHHAHRPQARRHRHRRHRSWRQPGRSCRSFRTRRMRERHPLVSIELAGRHSSNRPTHSPSLPIGFAAALIMIYVILAWLFSSYWQPFAVMLAIPFGLIGVIWGHLLARLRADVPQHDRLRRAFRRGRERFADSRAVLQRQVR
jgi:hydrophobic/amphiphilic exporter-1 (mainly G- bacteria), HAE1 family